MGLLQPLKGSGQSSFAYRQVIEKTRPGSLQQCVAAGQEKTGVSGDEKFRLNIKGKCFLHRDKPELPREAVWSFILGALQDQYSSMMLL